MVVRAIYGEHEALTEIAHAEQSSYLWAVMEALVEPGSSEAELEERFDLADQIGREWLAEVFESPAFAPWRRGEPTSPEAPGSEAPSGTGAEGRGADPGEANTKAQKIIDI